MLLSSSAFSNNSLLPKKYSCDGEGVNPPLIIGDVPPNAKSLALLVEDLDAPMGTFIHWIIYNIAPSTKEIVENSVPKGSVQGLTSMQQLGFVAACPPSGQHRYVFTLYALDTTILDQSLTEYALKEKIRGHILTQSNLVGLYSR